MESVITAGCLWELEAAADKMRNVLDEYMNRTLGDNQLKVLGKAIAIFELTMLDDLSYLDKEVVYRAIKKCHDLVAEDASERVFIDLLPAQFMNVYPKESREKMLVGRVKTFLQERLNEYYLERFSRKRLRAFAGDTLAIAKNTNPIYTQHHIDELGDRFTQIIDSEVHFTVAAVQISFAIHDYLFHTLLDNNHLIDTTRAVSTLNKT